MDKEVENINYSVSIKEGICYFDFFNEITMQNILSSELQAISLLDKHNIDILPFIMNLTNIDDAEVKIEVRDFGKLISSRSLNNRCSGVWMVGAKGTIKMLLTLLNKTFLENRIHFVDTLEEAIPGAEAMKHIKIPMLEQDVI